MKTQKLIDLERDRLGLIADARSTLEKLNETTDDKDAAELGRKHEALMRSLDENTLDMEQAKLDADGDEHRASRRPGSSGEVTGSDDGGSNWLSGKRCDWRDQRGNPVRVLARDERMAERDSGTVSMGDLVRAQITGARNEEEKRALSEGTDSAGGYTVPTPLADRFLDRMRAASVAIRAGALTVPMESETLAIARLASDPTVAWRAENASIAEGDPTFERCTFTAKTLAGGIKLSRELAEDSINVGAMIENAFAKAMAEKLDYAAIWGDGSSNSPTGVASTVGINTVSIGVPFNSYDDVIDGIYELQLDNAADPTAMIMHPRTNAAMAKLKDGDGNPLSIPEMVARVPRLLTTAAPIDETEDSRTDASSIVLGDFTQLMIGMRHQLEIRVFDQPYASTGQLYVVAWLRADVQLAHPAAFCTLTGILPVI